MRKIKFLAVLSAVIMTVSTTGTISASAYSPAVTGSFFASMAEMAEKEYLQAVPTKRVLKYGCRGEDIRILQLALCEWGYYSDSIDSSFGPNCKKAVIAYQKAKGLSPDGCAGPQTLVSINADINTHNNLISEARASLKTENDSEKNEENAEVFPSESEISQYFSTMFDMMYAPGLAPSGFKTPYDHQTSGPNKNAYSYQGYCGLYVANRLLCSGVYKDNLDVNCNGKEWYNKLYCLYSDGAKTSGGYTCKFYENTDKNSISSLLEIIGNGGYTGKILLSFPKQSNGSTKYGHVVLIDFFNSENGTVYWTDSYAFKNTPQGWQHKASVAEFERLYKKYGSPSAVVFVK